MTAPGAEGIVPLVSNSPLISWHFFAAAAKLKGTAILKDLQPVGIPDKEHKHQAYDLTFQGDDKLYTCRTDPKNSTNTTDFIIGRKMEYEVNGKKAKIKTSENEKVDCKVVRVEDRLGTP